MNVKEYQRITTPPLPKIDETNLKIIIRKYNDIILTLSKRDEDKEKRIRALEEYFKRTSGKRSFIRYFGNRYRIRAEDEAPFRLLAEYSTDNWETIAATTQLAP